MITSEEIQRIREIENKTLRVCEYCTHFNLEKVICEKTKENTGLFQNCDNFDRKLISFEIENHIPYI